MVEQSKSILSGYKNVQVIHASMEKVALLTKADVIYLPHILRSGALMALRRSSPVLYLYLILPAS